MRCKRREKRAALGPGGEEPLCTVIGLFRAEGRVGPLRRFVMRCFIGTRNHLRAEKALAEKDEVELLSGFLTIVCVDPPAETFY